ncbi:MAG: hypothetical protein AAF849_06365 [Bacteroidota bacterium]
MKNKKIFRALMLIALVAIVFLLGTDALEAQCPMCRMAAESNLKDGGTAGKGLNNGILYMLATPYFVIGTIAFVWWRNRKKEDES